MEVSQTPRVGGVLLAARLAMCKGAKVRKSMGTFEELNEAQCGWSTKT